MVAVPAAAAAVDAAAQAVGTTLFGGLLGVRPPAEGAPGVGDSHGCGAGGGSDGGDGGQPPLPPNFRRPLSAALMTVRLCAAISAMLPAGMATRGR